MEAMRQSWSDDRLDALNEKVDQGFDQVDRRFAQVDRRFDQVEGDIKDLRRETTMQFESVHKRFDSLQQTIMQMGALVVVALLGVIGTQL